MYRKLINKKNNRGVSLAEMLIVVAILLILMAVAVPSVITIQRNLRQTELDAKAEMIYVAVQNKLSKMKAGGNTAVFQHVDDESNKVFPLQGEIPGDADKVLDNIKQGDIFYFLSSSLSDSNSAATIIMDSNTVDESLLNNHWVIEFNPKSAVVYAVFYSEDRAECDKEYVDEFVKYDYNLRNKENRARDGARVGYYGGGSAVISSTVTTLSPSLSIINAETLSAEITCTVPASITEFPVFKVDLSDTKGHTFTKYYAYFGCDSEYRDRINAEANGINNVDYLSMKRSARTFRLSLTLDDLSTDATRFKNLYGAGSSHTVKLEEGTPLKITVTVKCPGNYNITQNLSDTKVTNSLFADHNSYLASDVNRTNNDYGTEAYPAVISYGRHLQNLDSDSGVSEDVQYAIQSSDITFTDIADVEKPYDWSEQYQTSFYNGFTQGRPNFKPIKNERLLRYDGASYRVINLIEERTTDVGLFEHLGNNQTIKNVFLTGTNVVSKEGSAGALVGSVSGNASIEHCQVFLTSNDIAGKSNENVWISGKTAGGLIGVFGKSRTDVLSVKNCSASTVVGNFSLNGTKTKVEVFEAESVGGLIGKIEDGNAKLLESYADCYLVGKVAGGLVGASAGTVNISYCYSAGFLTYDQKGAGFICGSANMDSSYTVAHRNYVPSDVIPYYATAVSGNVVGYVYYATGTNVTENGNLPENHGDNKTQPFSNASTIGEITSNLNRGQSIFKQDTSDSVPYNLMKQSLTTYTYPVLTYLAPDGTRTSFVHYGDWEATFQVGALVYYEEYRTFDKNGNASLPTYGFYGANVDSTLKDDPNITVVGDGYGLVYRKSGDVLPENVTVTILDGDNVVKEDTFSLKSLTPKLVTYDGVQYNVYPFPSDIVNTTTASEAFYLKAKIATGETNQDYYFFNPHFAKKVIYLTDPEAGVPGLTKDDDIFVRTGRHLYMMSLYYEKYAEVTKESRFLQERNIDYSKYSWKNYCPRTVENPTSQGPIAGNAIPFRATYDGNCNWITNVSFITDQGYYVGFFGRNEGTIKNVVLRASYTENSNNNYYVGRTGTLKNNEKVYMGILTGLNEKTGRISNCAVAGYYVAGSDGTIYAYQGSYLYAGGFVGSNLGNIRNCTADTPTLRLSATFANAYLGGFVGLNESQISDSYALGHIQVVFARGGNVSIAGFAGRNIGNIRNSYCATALTASGESTVSYGFAPAGGTVTLCNYLNDGTYSYVKHLYPFNFEGGAGTPATYSDLKVAVGSAQAVKYSFDFNNTVTVSKRYPFRAVVTDSDGNRVHYGDWLDDENMGTVGIFYWERETGGKNNGYHFTYLGTNDGKAIGGTSLCTSHDDGGIIAEYGYGFFELNKGSVKKLKISGATTKNGSELDLSQNIVYNTVASEALQKQMRLNLADGGEAAYSFYAFTTRTPEEAIVTDTDNGNYLCMNGTVANSTWTLEYEKVGGATETYIYTVSPFFANAMSTTDGVEITASDGSKTDYSKEPGKENNYEIRSIEQLQFINWRMHNGSNIKLTYKDVTTEGNREQFPYECAEGSEKKHYSQTHDLANKTDDNGSVKEFYALGRAGRPFMEHYNGNSYQIKNIRIEMSTSSYVGLFGELGGGTVLENVIMCAEPGKGIIDNQYCPYSGGDGYREPVTGALAGMVWVKGNEITIKNCSASGYIVKYSGKIPQNSGFYRYISVGGLVGSLFSGKLENCSAANTVVVDSSDLRGFRQQLGGLVGTAGNANNNSNYSVIENCYSGGEIVPDKNETITANYLCGGLIGNGAGHDQQQSYKGTETQINNCYTYCNISESKSNANGAVPEFNGFYYIAPNIETSGKISGGYYLLQDQKNSAVPMGTGYSYTQMSDGTLLQALGGNASETGNTSNKDAGFHAVTTTEGNGANVDGKYSFPNLSALEGKNYPFPAVIQQKDLIFSTADQVKYVYVHYGDWPTNGPYWENGFDTMDIFLNMDQDTNYAGYATKVFYLNPNSLLTSKPDPNDFESSVDSVAKVVAVGEIDSQGLYPVTVQALNKGTTNITLKGTSASFVLEVTANIQILSDYEELLLKEGETGKITLSAVTNVADPVNAKHFETKTEAFWKVESDNGGITTGDLVEVSQQDAADNKNIWNVTRNGMGKVSLTATFTYNYHGKEFSTEKFIEVSQPDTIGLFVENKFYATFLLDSSSAETSATGIFTEYAVDEPYAGKGDFFLYLDSGVKNFSDSDIRIEQVEVNGDIIAKDDTSSTTDKDCYKTSDNIYVWLDKQQTSDNLYKYLSGDIYRKIDSGALTPVENVKLKLTLKDGRNSYIFDVTISKVETKKQVEVQYLDENGVVKITKSILSGKNKLLTRQEATDAGFVAPSGKVLGGWQLVGTNHQYDLGGEYQFTKDSTQFQIVWKNFDITFVLNGGELNSNYNYEDVLPTGTEVTKAGYEFMGWYDNPAFEGDVKTKLPAEDDLIRTFYAKWRPLNTVLYLIDGERRISHTIADGDDKVADYIKPEHSGYTLLGWYTKNGDSPDVMVLSANGEFVLNVPGFSNSSGFVTEQETLELFALWGKDSTKSTKYVPTESFDSGKTYLIVNSNLPGNNVRAFGLDNINSTVTISEMAADGYDINGKVDIYIELLNEENTTIVFKSVDDESKKNMLWSDSKYFYLEYPVGHGSVNGTNDAAYEWSYNSETKQLDGRRASDGKLCSIGYIEGGWSGYVAYPTDNVNGWSSMKDIYLFCESTVFSEVTFNPTYTLTLYTSQADSVSIIVDDSVTDVSTVAGYVTPSNGTNDKFKGWYSKSAENSYTLVIDEKGIVKSGITDNMVLFAGWENSTNVINYIKEETGPTAGNKYLIVKNENGVDYALSSDSGNISYKKEVVVVQGNQINSLDDDTCIWECTNIGNSNNLKFSNGTSDFNVGSNKVDLGVSKYFKQNSTTSKKMIYADEINSASLTMFSLEESTQEFNSSLENKVVSENISEEQEIQGEVVETEESTGIKQEENDLPDDSQVQDDQSEMPEVEKTILPQGSKDALPKEPESLDALIKDDESESGTPEERDVAASLTEE